MTMVHRLCDNAQSRCQPRLSPVTDAPPAASQFERIVRLSLGSPSVDANLIAILLTSACPGNNRGCEVLRPLWAEEAMHRAYGFLRLIGARNQRGQATTEFHVAAGGEDFAARDLVTKFRILESGAGRAMRPCCSVLRDIVNDVWALFGCSANIVLRTNIDRLSLPAFKRRALVLAACELVCNALLHAFAGRVAGAIDVSLTLRDPRSACLRVVDNGVGFNTIPPNLTGGVAAGMAGLLEADLAYDRQAGWTSAEIVFPVPDA